MHADCIQNILIISPVSDSYFPFILETGIERSKHTFRVLHLNLVIKCRLIFFVYFVLFLNELIVYLLITSLYTFFFYMNKGGGGSKCIFELTDFLKGSKYNLSFQNDRKFRSSQRRCSIKDISLKIPQYSWEKAFVGVSFFDKNAFLQVCNFIKKRLQHMFPVNVTNM